MTDPSDMQMDNPTYENLPIEPSITTAGIDEIKALVEDAKKMFLDAFGEAYKAEPNFSDYVENAFTETHFLEEWENSSNTFWIMKANGALLGYAKTTKDVLPDCIQGGKGLEIKRFYLDKAYHGKGYASTLMECCLEQARKESCNIVWLGVWPQNTKAIKFYKKQDFHFCGEIEFKLGDKIEWDWVMKKELF